MCSYVALCVFMTYLVIVLTYKRYTQGGQYVACLMNICSSGSACDKRNVRDVNGVYSKCSACHIGKLYAMPTLCNLFHVCTA